MTRAAFGGNFSVSVVNEKAAPQIATVRNHDLKPEIATDGCR